MSDLVLTATCQPGQCTPNLAIELQAKLLTLLNVIADDLSPGAVWFELKTMTWVDDGIDEIVVRVEMGHA